MGENFYCGAGKSTLMKFLLGLLLCQVEKVFLMDNPLSNLDAKLRNQMRAEIVLLREKLDTTFIYVTHDQTEAMTLGDRIVIMRDGYIMQVGTPIKVFEMPNNLFVAGFIGAPQINFINAQLLCENGKTAYLVLSQTGRKVEEEFYMYKVLAIGNSFSEDATHFLHQICESSGIENEVINLYIGGCSLERHWRNIENGCGEYQYQKNGAKTDRYVSIQEVLRENQFDVIVTHQVSGDSGWENTYEPFLGLILNYLSNHSDAEIYLNQTWAYEKSSNHENFMRYNRDQQQMFNRLEKAYEIAAQRHSLPLIKSGEVVQRIRETPYFKNGSRCITRDGFHMNFLYGRYAVALMWAKVIAKIDVTTNSFLPTVEFMPFESADTQIVNQIKQIVCDIN